MSLFDAILAGKLTGGGSGGSLPKPIPYEYMPEGYPKVEAGEVTLFDQTVDGFAESGGVYRAIADTQIDVKVGKKYTVFWDGVEYADLVAFDGDGAAVIGSDPAGEFTEELPFTIMMDDALVFGTIYTATSHSVKITQFKETVEPVAYKFMPEGYPKDNSFAVENKYYEEGDVAVSSGMFVKVSGQTIPVDKLPSLILEVQDGTSLSLPADTWMASDDKGVMMGADGLCAIAYIDNASFGKFTFPEKGFYLLPMQDELVNIVSARLDDITPIAYKFLPPVTKLYADSSNVLYWDAEYTTGVTVAELRELIQAVPYTVFVMSYNSLSCLALIAFRDGGKYNVDIHTDDGAFMPIDYVGGR